MVVAMPRAQRCGNGSTANARPGPSMRSEISSVKRSTAIRRSPRQAGFNAHGRWTGGMGGRNPINKIKSLVDTGTARLTKVRSMPVISADDADYTEKRFAREQSRVLRRKMGNGDMEIAAPLFVRDFLIRGTAYGKIERVGGDTEFRRTPAYEVVYDHREALYSKITQRAHVRPESRDVLVARFPAMEKEILAAPQFNRIDAWMSYTYVGPGFLTADMVEVAESWHPPIPPTAERRRQWIVCLRNKTDRPRARRGRAFAIRSSRSIRRRRSRGVWPRHRALSTSSPRRRAGSMTSCRMLARRSITAASSRSSSRQKRRRGQSTGLT